MNAHARTHAPSSAAGWRAVLCAAGCGALLGCEVAGTMVAPQDEYGAYRSVRTARTVEDRLRASDAYLDRYPAGRWADEVRPWFDRAEMKFFVHREESPAGLQEYLQVLPRGPHAAIARIELDRHRSRVAEGRKSRLEIDARYTEARLAALARLRENARDTLGAWVGRTLSIDSWDERTTALDHEFIYAWRIDKPAGRCVEDLCSKLVELPFELPGGGDQAPRELDFEVVLVLQQGMLQEVSLRGPGMFSRLFEAARSRPVVAGDVPARVQAIAFAIEFLSGAVEARLPASRCNAEIVGEVVFKRACDGWSIEALAPGDPGADDRIVIRGPRAGARP